MSFPKYATYKDSGIGWLGLVPESWGVGQSRRLFGLRMDRAKPTDQQLTASQKHGVIYQSDFMKLENQKVVQVLKGADILKHVEPNDFVISMRSFQGGIESCKVGGCISSAYVVLIPGKDVYCSFYSYLFKSVTYIQALQSTSNLVRDGQALRYNNFCMVHLPLIPYSEQKQIAAFLDREVAKIDALIREQEKLIEVLKEKRQAVVLHAVTKGLNLIIPMRSSGIQWLGEVPKHWDVLRLKFLCDVRTGDKDTENSVADGIYPFFVRSQTIERINSKAFDCEAVLTAGDGAGVGKVFHYYDGPFDFHQRVYLMHNFKGIRGEFFFYYLKENFFKVALEGGAKSTVDSLRRPMLTNFPVCVPPLEEQISIVEAIKSQSTTFDNLSAQSERAIDLLQERRSALISAAVTGKIDVRNLVDAEVA